MSMARNMRRLTKKAEAKNQDVPIPNYHIAHKKLRKYGVDVHYDSRAGQLLMVKKTQSAHMTTERRAVPPDVAI